MIKNWKGIAVGSGLVAVFLFGAGRASLHPGDEDEHRPLFREARAQFMKSELSAHRRARLLADPVTQRDYDVFSYRLDLTIDEVAENVSGSVFMSARSLVDGLSSVEYDLYDNMEVESVKSGGQDLPFTHSNDIIAATLPTPINQGESFMIRTTYSGTPQSIGWGTFGFDWHGSSPIIWSLSEPDYARTWWPCNDFLPDKADSVEVWLTVSDELVATSNGMLQQVVDNGDGTKTYQWKERYPITTYLVSLAITNYETISDWYVSAGGDSMPVTHYVYPEHYGDAVVDFSVTVPMIGFFSETYGEYPFLEEKYGHSIFPWGGAMEHQTNTSYGSWLITGDHYFDWIVAHELAHSWWGNLITCETWEDIWLNEGFASYSEALWVEDQEGFYSYRNYMIALDYYYSGGDFPGSVYDPDDTFNDTVYNKGAWVLHMLRHVLGDEEFFPAFWAYGHDPDLMYGSATTAEFQAVMEEESGRDLDWFFQEWVYGENRPDYEYWWQAEPSGNEYRLTVYLGQTQTNAPVFRMPVDIQTIIPSGETTFTVVDSLESQEFIFTLPETPSQVYVDRYNWILKHIRQISVGIGKGEPGVTLPRALVLHQNSPNPFNPSTAISYDIPESLDGAEMSLEIYDLRGRQVKALRSGPATPGAYVVQWDGRDARGRPVGSGIYIYRLRVGHGIETRRMLLLK